MFWWAIKGGNKGANSPAKWRRPVATWWQNLESSFGRFFMHFSSSHLISLCPLLFTFDVQSRRFSFAWSSTIWSFFGFFSEAGHNGVLLVQRRVNVREWAECTLYSKIVSRTGTYLLYMFVPSWIILNCFACGVLFLKKISVDIFKSVVIQGIIAICHRIGFITVYDILASTSEM